MAADSIATPSPPVGDDDNENNDNNNLAPDSADGKAQATSGAGGGACGANIAMATPNTSGMIMQIMLLFGSLPIIIKRRKK
ncbi:MAG: hypothetical protein HYY43_02720 [Deltaproteobacteria bacterium]|nr:hypothetical protein [Deltaproteobacteria bacterium]MBI2974487.1 hypothetical protein [Deltaproteobacteria bacterium]